MKHFIIFSAILITLGSCTKQNSSTYERFYLKTDGANLAVEVNGNIASNTFILLLHGGPGGSGHEYNTGEYTATLEQQYAMVYLDQRGQGASSGQYDKNTITLQQYADDAYELVKLLKGKYGEGISVFLMGHSWGGTTGTYALLNTNIQDEIKGWLEVDGAHDIPLLNKEAIQLFIEIGNQEVAANRNVEKWQEILNFANGVDTNNITIDQGGQINRFGQEAEGLIEDLGQGSSNSNGESHGLLTNPILSLAASSSTSSTAGVITPETENAAMTDELHKVTTPSLFLWGKYDFIVPPALAYSAYERVSSISKRVVIFDRSGHSPMDSEASLFIQEVIDFVETHK